MLDESDEADVVGRRMHDWVVADDREAFRRYRQQVQSGHSGTLGYGVASSTGVKRSMETTAVPLSLADGT